MAHNLEGTALPFSVSAFLKEVGAGLVNPAGDPSVGVPLAGDRDSIITALHDKVRLLTEQVRTLWDQCPRRWIWSL